MFDWCFGHFSRIFLLLAGAYLILKGDMTLGGLTSIILLAGLVGEGLKTIGSIPANLQNARVGADRLQKLLAMEDEEKRESLPDTPQGKKQVHRQVLSRTDQPPEGFPVYRVQGLSFSYGASPVPQNCSGQAFL